MRKFLLTLFSLFALVNVATAQSYSHTLAKNDIALGGGETTLSDYVWTSTAVDYIGSVNATKGLQIGKAPKDGVNYHIKSFTLSTSAFAEYSIDSITVNTSTAASAEITMKIAVGTDGETFTLTNNAADYTYTCNKAKGDITITWEQTETEKALYVKTITIYYALPAGVVEVSVPVFKTAEGTYADKVTVEAETTDANAILFYTLDDTEPSYEDYKAGGSTKRTGYNVMQTVITESTTVKVIAVIEDGDAVYSSNVAKATFTVEKGVAYVPSNTISGGQKYGIFVEDSIAMPDSKNQNFDYLYVRKSTKPYKQIYYTDIAGNAFTITETDGGYTIQDPNGRYLYTKNDNYKNFNFAAEKPAEGAVWSISFDADYNATITNVLASKTIYYSPKYHSFGCYPATSVTEEMVLPRLYLMGAFPEFTITPAAGQELDSFQKLTITCEKGIKPADGLSVSYNYNENMSVKQVDENTLELSIKQPDTAKDNKTVFIYFEGSVILDPTGISVPMTIEKNRIMYTIVGETAAATIDDVAPANNSTVESLSYFLFTFSKISLENENAENKPRLYKEGSNESFELKYTNMNEEGTANIKFEQCALKVVNGPIVEKGTYILEIPNAYFIDQNGRDVEGITLKYVVENDLATSVENVVASDVWVVYSISGVRLMETSNVNDVNALPAGLYIVNGVKTLVK